MKQQRAATATSICMLAILCIAWMSTHTLTDASRNPSSTPSSSQSEGDDGVIEGGAAASVNAPVPQPFSVLPSAVNTDTNADALASPHISAKNALASSSSQPIAAPNDFTCQTGHHRSRFAYVMMHYEGTSKDDEYLLGLRVLIRSIQDTKTPYDIVVITSTNVRESSKAALIADGAILNEVQNMQNPFETKVTGRNSYKSRFVYSFNKLYIWNMTCYERIIFLDSDNIFLSNMDEVFFCGHFCVVYMNPLIFHTGLIVVKPDNGMFNKLVHALYSDESFSHDGADQGFLVAQFDIEHAPLFLPQQYLKTGKPSEEPAMRLNIGWNINHFWYYIAFDWSWFFNGGAGTEHEYSWIKAYRSEAVGSSSGELVGGSSLAYCSGMMLKPWYWFPTMYFTHHYSWHEKRALLNINYYPILFSRLAAFVPIFLLFQYFNNRARIDRITCIQPIRHLVLRAFLQQPVVLGYVYGAICFFLHGFIVFQLIPYVTPPTMAWFIWSFWHIGLMYISLQLLVNIFLRPTSGDDGTAAANSVTGLHALGLLVLAQAIFFVNWLNIYPHFIVKIGIFENLLMIWIGLQCHVFRRATERMAKVALVVKS